jgi:hypothetical protein
VPLQHALANKIEDAGLERVAEIEARALPAFAWLAGSRANSTWDLIQAGDDTELAKLIGVEGQGPGG